MSTEPVRTTGRLDSEGCYRALASRDDRFDGRFFVGVVTTGVYCRPVCPAPTPRSRNARFYACAAAAEEAGFRPCRRCRPETAPGTPAWMGSSATVTRALRLIEAGALDRDGVDILATRLGVGARQVRRLFAEHLGASPIAVARTRRVHFARRLIDETRLPMSEVALAAGFASIRQFNHSIVGCFGRPPTQLRREAQRRATPSNEELVLRLAVRRPFDWEALLGFLAGRAIPGVEQVEGESYSRSVELDARPCMLRVEPGRGGPTLELRLRVDVGTGTSLLPVVERVRRVFDLSADPLRIAADLRHDRDLKRRIDARPGLRVPGAWDAFELAVRAVLGQQVSVKGATRLAGRLVEGFGKPLEHAGAGPTHLFPRPERLAEADLSRVGLPRARAATLRRLATEVARGRLELGVGAGLEETVRRLLEIPGIGEWTAHYVAMRALGEPDAFPAADLGLRRALGRRGHPLSPAALARRAESWRPWRAYAAMWLWTVP